MRELGLYKIILSSEKSFKRYIIIPNILNPKKNHLLKMSAVFFAIQYNPFRNRSSVRKPIKTQCVRGQFWSFFFSTIFFIGQK